MAAPFTTPDRPYTIMIDEGQRALIETALLNFVGEEKLGEDDREQLTLLRDMIADLPNQERESPGCIHGLCL